jgi:hypothetical protein
MTLGKSFPRRRFSVGGHGFFSIGYGIPKSMSGAPDQVGDAAGSFLNS